MTAPHVATPGLAPATRWLRRTRPVADPRVRLVCFPHAGGAASFFRDWPQLLAADIDVSAICYPGREDRYLEPFAADMAELAGTLAGALTPFLDRPTAFFGHSMGASVAHEVALRLEERHGFVLDRLLVSSRAAPSRLRSTGVSRAGDDVLLRDVRTLGGAVSGALDDPGLRELLLPVIRADYRLTDDYRPGTPRPLAAPVSAFLGDGDPHVSPQDMRAWAACTRAGFELTVLPGDHFYLVGSRPWLLGDLDALLGGRPGGPVADAAARTGEQVSAG